MSGKITAEHLRRKAIVYVRQSTPGQVAGNLESQRRQYALQDTARALGFTAVEVIDDDLGRSGSGSVKRPGFERLVAAICTGEVGVVLCLEASRLARNGRDWHHVIDLCGLVGTLVADSDGVYDPRLGNDRLILRLKGTMSEFELGLIRQRSLEAIRSKASRGELEYAMGAALLERSLVENSEFRARESSSEAVPKDPHPYAMPIGFSWTHHGKIELEPDKRIQEAIRLVFQKFVEVGSAVPGSPAAVRARRRALRRDRDDDAPEPAFDHGHDGTRVHTPAVSPLPKLPP